MTQTMKTTGVKGRPRVLIVGSEDVHARIDLMRALAGNYVLAAAGSARDAASRFEANGFSFYHYPLGRGVGPFTDSRAFVTLVHILHQFQPDIVHAFDTKPGVYGCLAARFVGVPVVIGTVTGLGSLYVDDGLSVKVVRGVYERLQRMASQYADLTVFQNRDDRDEFVGRRIVPAARAVVIAGSGVATERFDPARFSEADRREVRASLGIHAEAPLVTMISRVIRSKGVEDFVAAAQQTRQSLPHAEFLLVGPGDENSVDRFDPAELQQIRDTVRWPGARSDIAQILAASDLFVLPSHLREGIPRVLLEAASMGLPLITTDSPGCNDVVEDGVNGRLVPAHDPYALSEAIVSILNQPELRSFFGRVSRQRAVERFDLSVVAERTRMHYDELLAKKTGRLRCRA